jgi:hypothetical protein
VTDVDAVSDGADEVEEDEAASGGKDRPAAAPAGVAEEGPPRQTRPAPIGGRDRARVPPRATTILPGSDGSGRGAPDSDAATDGFEVPGRWIPVGGFGGRRKK